MRRSAIQSLAASALLLVLLFAAHGAMAAEMAVTVTVSPSTATVSFGSSQQFSLTVAGAVNSSVTWSVNGIPGGNAVVGLVNSAGKYTAPLALPAGNPVTVSATSVEDPAAAATAAITVRYPTPVVQWFSPAKVPLGPTTFIVNGSAFYNGAVVKLEGVALPTTFLSSTQLKVASNFSQSGSGNITATNPGPTNPTSAPRLIEIGLGILVSITPNPASVPAGTKQQFTATVTGTSNTQVYWYVDGGSTNGTITSSGLYSAPAVVPAAPFTVRAVCAVNNERSDMATVTVTAPTQTVSVTIAPTSATVQTGSTKQFTATVTGTTNTAVIWKVSDVAGGNSTVGTINGSGFYAAPASVPSGVVSVSATSQADTTKTATASVTVTATPVITVSVSPPTASVQSGATRQFSATVSGTSNILVTWQVNGLAGGNSITGTISAAGLYTAPASVPSGAVTVTAVSQADPSKSGSATITVTAAPVMVTVSISPLQASLMVNGAQQFAATVTGSPNTAVTWQVNNVAGGSSSAGTIDASGLYTAPGALPAAAITVAAVSQADPTKSAAATVTIIDPQAITIGRFLEQSSFGPTPQLTAHVAQIGTQGWLDEQFNTPESVFPNGVASSANEMLDQLYLHFMTGQDQLRQRVVHTLSEVIVISRNKNYYPNMLIPWLQILSRNAFGNYKDLLKEITLDASMGNFLDMVNSAKPGVAGGANENYPREVMQLFSIGVYQLNPDGSQKLDPNNQPIPTYTQTDVRQLALALTGWTFNRSGSAPTSPNPNYYPGPMVPLASYHDTTSKTFLGHTLPAGQTMQKDVDDALEIIFNHPNVGPFLATRLIRGLATSNPTAAYIARVAAVFNDNGQGTRGDMKAVIRAILLDPEARNDTPSAGFGKLRSPLLHDIALFRVLGATIAAPSQITYVYDNMGESVLNAPSVFGHYSPGYRIPQQTPPLFGPEFQIHGPGELINDGNFLWNFMNYYQTGIWDLQWLFNLGADRNACINAVDNLLLYGRMSAGLRQSLQTALQAQAAAGADPKMQALTVLYLTAMSSEYLVMH